MERLRKKLLTRLAPKGSKRSLRCIAEAEAAAKTDAEIDRASQLLDEAKNTHQRLEKVRTDLIRQHIEVQSLEAQVDALGARLFPQGASFPVLDRLTQEVDVLLLVKKLVPLESQREKRARTALVEAESRMRRTQKIVREILQLSIRLGIANDSRDRVLPASSSKMTKLAMPLLLQAKTELGDFYTWMAKARMRQTMVHSAQTIHMIDLTRLPGKRDDSMDRDGMQKAIEKMFSQVQHGIAFVQEEIRVSKAREKNLYTFGEELTAQIQEARKRVRVARACVLEADHITMDTKLASYEAQLPAPPGSRVPTGVAEKMATEAEAEAEAAAKEAAESDSNTAVTSYSLTSTMVSVPGAAPELYHWALARLHQRLGQGDVEARTDLEDEDLPWHMHALGF